MMKKIFVLLFSVVGLISFKPKLDTVNFKSIVKSETPLVANEVYDLSQYGLKAFITAEGFGKNTTGGRGGAIYIVNSLSDANVPGTLRYAASQSGPRYAIITVNGYSSMAGPLDIDDPNMTVLNLAEGGGITYTDNSISIQKSNVILRGLRTRRTNDNTNYNQDALKIVTWTGDTTQNVIVDHHTSSWGIDEAVDIGNAGNGSGGTDYVTIQRSILGPNNIYGVLVGSGVKRLSFTKNLFVKNDTRNPIFASPFGVVELKSELTGEMVNNVIYASGGTGGITYGLKTNWIGNSWIDYTGQTFCAACDDWLEFTTAGEEGNMRPLTEIYTFDNNIVNGGTGQDPSYPVRVEEHGNIAAYKVNNPIQPSGIVAMEANANITDVANNVGSIPWDSYDASVINSLNNLTNPRIDETQVALNNTPYKNDTDNDGLPDDFESQTGATNPIGTQSNYTYNGKTLINNPGYDNIEIFSFFKYDIPYLTPTTVIPNLELTELLAFPDAKGSGKNTVGGRNGTVIDVVNLNATGTGSLKWALEENYPRIVNFKVCGTIDMGNQILDLKNPFITINGITSCGDGIEIINNGMFIQTQQAIIDNLRFRRYNVDRFSYNAINIGAFEGNVTNIILNNISVSWGFDENFVISTAGNNVNGMVENITIQNSITSQNNHLTLMSVGAKNVTFYNNLFAFGNDRAPTASSPYGVDEITNYIRVEMVNNTVYYDVQNQGMGFLVFGLKASYIKNLYKSPPSVNIPWNFQITSAGENLSSNQRPNTEWYLEGNINFNTGVSPTIGNNVQPEYLVSTPFSNSGITPMPISEILPSLDSVGTLPHDSNDADIINRVRNGSTRPTTGILRPDGYYEYDVVLAGGTPMNDSNIKGIDNSFSTAHGITNTHQIKTNWTFGTYTMTNTAGYPAIEIFTAWKKGTLDKMVGEIGTIDPPVIIEPITDYIIRKARVANSQSSAAVIISN